MASTYLERNMTGNTASTKMTFSCWLKKSNPATDGRVFGAQALACHAYWLSTGELRVDFSQKDSGSAVAALKTNRKFRDTNAWYHIVFALDTTLGTADDRIKLWVNGVQETSFAVRTNASQNATYAYGQSGYYTVGARTSNQGGAGHYFDGLMSHVHYCDGYAYAASDFGSTDSTTGEWKINTSPSVSYGTNGFFLLKNDNSANDQSGNSNNFTASGTLTKTEDNPSNVFATLNPLSVRDAQYSLTYGNNRLNTGSSQEWGSAVASTLGATGGKFYWEVKWNAGDGYSITGVIPANKYHTCAFTSGTAVYSYANGLQLNAGGTGTIYNAVGSNGTLPQQTVGHIFMFALDMENKKMWFGSNGTWYNSGNPGAGSNETWGSSEFTADDTWVPYAQGYQISSDTTFNFNFGNGSFEGTAVASAGTNASGNGIFEYDVPTGFTALSTKGLNL